MSSISNKSIFYSYFLEYFMISILFSTVYSLKEEGDSHTVSLLSESEKSVSLS